MEYTSGTVGRVILARVDHGEDLLGAITGLAETEGIDAALVLMLGALESGRMAQGPKALVLPPSPVFAAFSEGRELLGAGTLLREEGRPVLHLHAATGRAGATSVGCLRDEAVVYATVEVVILELALGAVRRRDPVTGLALVAFDP